MASREAEMRYEIDKLRAAKKERRGQARTSRPRPLALTLALALALALAMALTLALTLAPALTPTRSSRPSSQGSTFGRSPASTTA